MVSEPEGHRRHLKKCLQAMAVSILSILPAPCNIFTSLTGLSRWIMDYVKMIYVKHSERAIYMLCIIRFPWKD